MSGHAWLRRGHVIFTLENGIDLTWKSLSHFNVVSPMYTSRALVSWLQYDSRHTEKVESVSKHLLSAENVSPKVDKELLDPYLDGSAHHNSFTFGKGQ